MTGSSRARMIVATVVGVIAIIIVFQNIRPVDTMVLFWQVTLPHVVLLAIVFAGGMILGALLSGMRRKRMPQGTGAVVR